MKLLHVMKRFNSQSAFHHIRNVGIIAHIDAGKTTTTERMLFYSGRTHYLGDVDRGDTVTDYLDQERERGISIVSAAATLRWHSHEINLIDTPGHVDFSMEVTKSLCVLDGTVCVLDATKGVQAQTVNVWRQATRYAVPRMIYANKLDRVTSTAEAKRAIEKCVTSVSKRLGKHTIAVPVHMPYFLPSGLGERLAGIVDLIEFTVKKWDLTTDPEGNVYSVEKIKTDHPLFEETAFYRQQLIESLADFDEALAEQYVLMENQAAYLLPAKSIQQSLRKATISGQCAPLLCGSSRRNIGVQPLLDGILAYLPHPGERPALLEFHKLHPANQLCALVFKIIFDKHRGALAFVRLYTGHVTVGDKIHILPGVVAASSKHTFKHALASAVKSTPVMKILHLTGDHYEECKSAGPGSIVALTGLGDTCTGDLILSNVNAYAEFWHSEKQTLSKPSEVEEDEYDCNSFDQVGRDTNLLVQQLSGGHLLKKYSPVVFASIEPPSAAFQPAMENALRCLQREDPSIHLSKDEHTGRCIISGMGDLHLEVIAERVRREYDVNVHLGRVQIHYCERLELAQDTDQRPSLTHVTVVRAEKKVFPILLELELDILPMEETNNKVQFKNSSDFHWDIVHESIQRHLLDGIESALRSGPLLKSPIVGCHVIVRRLALMKSPTSPEFYPLPKEGVQKYHTFLHAITSAGRETARLLFSDSSVQAELMEPFMHLHVQINSGENQNLSNVLGDLSRRRAHIELVQESTSKDDGYVLKEVKARVPLAELVNYSSEVRKLTSGNADIHMVLANYEIVDQSQQEKILAAQKYGI